MRQSFAYLNEVFAQYEYVVGAAEVRFQPVSA